MMTDAEKKKVPCFAIRDGKTCAAGSSSLYSDEPKIIASRGARRNKAKAKSKAEPAAAAAEKAKSKCKGRKKARARANLSTYWHCIYSPAGCQKGSECTFWHEALMAAKVETASALAQPSAASTVSQPAGRADAQ